jgi:sugar O-acyltransferase (sialic acid O-acetyltransferase NeuD family)
LLALSPSAKRPPGAWEFQPFKSAKRAGRKNSLARLLSENKSGFMVKAIIFWGASGHAKVLQEFMPALGYELVAVFDNNPNLATPFPGVPLFIGMEGFLNWKRQWGTKDCAFLTAIGGSRGQDRLEIQRFLEDQGLVGAVAIHPTAFVAETAQLSPGCQVLAHAAVSAEVRLGAACIINTSASVDHESNLGDGVHIGPGATLTGCVSVGDYSMIGAGAVVLPRIRIGTNAVVGAGAVVTKDVADGTVVCGNPARELSSNN